MTNPAKLIRRTRIIAIYARHLWEGFLLFLAFMLLTYWLSYFAGMASVDTPPDCVDQMDCTKDEVYQN